MINLETAFDFISLENTWHPDTHFRTQSIWLLMKSCRNPVTHTFVCLVFNDLCKGLKSSSQFWKGRPNTVFPTIKRDEIHLFLSLFAHMYIWIGQKYFVSKALFSLLVCMYWPSRTSAPSQSEIFHLIAWTPLAFPLFVWVEREYFTLGGCAGLGRPIYTYKQREQDLGDRILISMHPQNCAKSWCYTNVMKNLNLSVMNNFPLLLAKPKFITFIPL